MTDNPPPALEKRGLRRVVENADGDVVLPSGLLMLFFGRELEKRLMPQHEAEQPKRRRVLMPPTA